MTRHDTQLPPSTFQFDLETIADEQLLGIDEIGEALARMARRSKKPVASQVRRWLQHGTRGVRLPSLLLLGRRVTTKAALLWWVQATTAAADQGYGQRQAVDAAPVARRPLTAHERKVLERAGVLPTGA